MLSFNVCVCLCQHRIRSSSAYIKLSGMVCNLLSASATVGPVPDYLTDEMKVCNVPRNARSKYIADSVAI